MVKVLSQGMHMWKPYLYWLSIYGQGEGFCARACRGYQNIRSGELTITVQCERSCHMEYVQYDSPITSENLKIMAKINI